MTTHIPSTPFMSAQNDPSTTDTSPELAGLAAGPQGKGVNIVKLHRRRTERKRAWDELSATDRAVLLEAVRQRRDAQQQQRQADHHDMRSWR